MGRGIVVTGRCFVEGMNADLRGGIDDIDMRRYLTYFDKIVYADSTHFGGSDSSEIKKYSNNSKELKGIIDRDILLERRVEISSIGTNIIPKAGVVPSTQEETQVMAVTRPTAQLEVLNDLRSRDSENWWVLGQTGNVLFLPKERQGIDTIDISFKNTLPVPTDCSFEKILELKKSKEDYFIEFQQILDGFAERVIKAENTTEEFIKAKEEIRKNLIAIDRSMKESKMHRKYSTLKTVIGSHDLSSLVSSGLGGGIGALFGGLDPIIGGVGALAGLGANAFVNYKLTKNIKIDNLDPNLSPYLYLYEVEKLNK